MKESRSIGMEIRIVSHLIRRNLGGSCPPPQNSVTGMQRMVLHFLADHSGKGDLFQRDVENAFSIRRSTVTGVLQLMEKNGLLVRESVPSDARLKKLVLTPEGLALHERIEADIHALEVKAIQGMTAGEVDQFFHLLGKIRQNLES